MATTHADVNAILADDKDIVAKQDGGILVVGSFGEQVLQAKNATELPAGIGDGTLVAATTSTAGIVKQATTVAAPAAITSVVAAGATPTKAEYDALRADVVALRTTVATLLANQKTAGQVA